MNRRERQVQERRQVILTAAMRLFETKGFAETSMEEIAEAADVARGTLYNHFVSKADVLVALRMSAKEKWQEDALKRAHAGDSPVAMIEWMLLQAAMWIDDHPHLASAFQEALPLIMAKQGLKLDQHIIVPSELVSMAQEKQELTSALPSEMLAFLLDMTMRYCVMAKLKGQSKGKIAAKAQIAIKELLVRLA